MVVYLQDATSNEAVWTMTPLLILSLPVFVWLSNGSGGFFQIAMVGSSLLACLQLYAMYRNFRKNPL